MQPAPVSAMQPAISLLEKTPVLLETLLRGLPQELLEWKSAPDRWSIKEVLAHLADIEQVYGERTRRFITGDSPYLQKYDSVAVLTEDKRAHRSARELFSRFSIGRRAILAFLHGVPASAGTRTATHSELGTITLAQMLNEWANHDLGHLRQIAELYRAHAFYPYSGPFQKYSNPKP